MNEIIALKNWLPSWCWNNEKLICNGVYTYSLFYCDLDLDHDVYAFSLLG